MVATGRWSSEAFGEVRYLLAVGALIAVAAGGCRRAESDAGPDGAPGATAEARKEIPPAVSPPPPPQQAKRPEAKQAAPTKAAPEPSYPQQAKSAPAGASPMAAEGNASKPAKEPPQQATRPAEPKNPPALAAPARARSLNEVIESLDDAVVLITCQDALKNDIGSGSGFVIDKSGQVATNYHVLTEAATAFAQFRDGRKFDVAGVRAVSPDRDLAIVQLKDCPASKEWITLREPTSLNQGDELMAIGHPSGFRFTVTTGIVSAVRKTEELPEQYKQVLAASRETVWVQSSAAISAGSSGGPLLDKAGTVVGVNTWIASGQNLGFAVHVRHLMELQRHLSEKPQPLPLAGLAVITDPRVAAIAQDYRREWEVVFRDLPEGASEQQIRRLAAERNLLPNYGDKLIELAEAHPKTSTGFEALMQMCRMCAGTNDVGSAQRIDGTVRRLAEAYLAEKRMEDLVPLLSGTPRKAVIGLVRRLAAESPHREVRGAATYVLAELLSSQFDGERLYLSEIRDLFDTVARDYKDLRVGGSRIDEQLDAQRFAARHLAIGAVAANIEGTDHRGAKFQLSDFRGKVTVLDFWVDWCPYCREMYPVERRLVERFVGAPFALVGVNGDERSTLEQLEARKTVTWRNWHDGPKGPIAKQWQITSWPTVYVLDPSGVVRYKDARGEQLVAAVESLLAEASLKLPQNLVARGSAWKYWEESMDQAGRWKSVDFDDATWRTVQTPAGYGWGDERGALVRRKTPTLYFRTAFQMDDPAKVSDLLLELCCDDGAAVYLNGEEVARSLLAPAAKFADFAALPRANHGRQPEHFSVDPKRLLRGKNVLAAEVHQADPDSTDLRFDLALNANAMPVLRKEIGEAKSPTRRLAVSVLGCFGSGAAGAVEELTKLFPSADLDMQVRTVAALLRIDPKQEPRIKLRPAKDERETQERVIQAYTILRRCWAVASRPGHSPHDYQDALQGVAKATALWPSLPDAAAYRALGQLRLGQAEQALKTLRSGTILKLTYRPVELACRCLAEQQLGQDVQAKQSLDQLRKMLKKPEWSSSVDAYELAQEAEAWIPKAQPTAQPVKLAAESTPAVKPALPKKP